MRNLLPVATVLTQAHGSLQGERNHVKSSPVGPNTHRPRARTSEKSSSTSSSSAAETIDEDASEDTQIEASMASSDNQFTDIPIFNSELENNGHDGDGINSDANSDAHLDSTFFAEYGSDRFEDRENMIKRARESGGEGEFGGEPDNEEIGFEDVGSSFAEEQPAGEGDIGEEEIVSMQHAKDGSLVQDTVHGFEKWGELENSEEFVKEHFGKSGEQVKSTLLQLKEDSEVGPRGYSPDDEINAEMEGFIHGMKATVKLGAVEAEGNGVDEGEDMGDVENALSFLQDKMKQAHGAEFPGGVGTVLSTVLGQQQQIGGIPGQQGIGQQQQQTQPVDLQGSTMPQQQINLQQQGILQQQTQQSQQSQQGSTIPQQPLPNSVLQQQQGQTQTQATGQTTGVSNTLLEAIQVLQKDPVAFSNALQTAMLAQQAHNAADSVGTVNTGNTENVVGNNQGINQQKQMVQQQVNQQSQQPLLNQQVTPPVQASVMQQGNAVSIGENGAGGIVCPTGYEQKGLPSSINALVDANHLVPSALIQRVGYLEPNANGQVLQRAFQNPLFDNRITTTGIQEGVACKAGCDQCQSTNGCGCTGFAFHQGGGNCVFYQSIPSVIPEAHAFCERKVEEMGEAVGAGGVGMGAGGVGIGGGNGNANVNMGSMGTGSMGMVSGEVGVGGMTGGIGAVGGMTGGMGGVGGGVIP